MTTSALQEETDDFHVRAVLQLCILSHIFCCGNHRRARFHLSLFQFHSTKGNKMTDSKPQPNKLKTIVVLSDGETWDYSDNCKYFEVPASWDGDAIEEFMNNEHKGVQ